MSRNTSARGQRGAVEPRSGQSSVRLSRREMEDSSHRLSKPKQQYSGAKSSTENAETYAVSYYQNNPDVVLDTRSPEEKMEELDSKLQDYDLESTEKFKILIHQKSLNYIMYGENSVEALKSHIALGLFYNENQRPSSALRHFLKAHIIEQLVQVEREDSIIIGIETAEAHIALRNDNRVESQKHINQAIESLSPFYDEQIEDHLLRYKKDLAYGHILNATGKFAQALEQYRAAYDSLNETNEGIDSPVTAKLFIEMAQAAEGLKDAKLAGEYYQKAYTTFMDCGMEESAAMFESKLPRDDNF